MGVAKTLGQLKVDDKSQEQNLNIIFINSVSNVEYEQADGSSAQYLLVRIPHRSQGAFKKVGGMVQDHLEILNDVCFPSHITGKSIRVSLEGKKHEKVMLDPLDKDAMEGKLDAIMHCYHKLTTHKIALGFSKPNSFQSKILSQRNKDGK